MEEKKFFNNRFNNMISEDREEIVRLLKEGIANLERGLRILDCNLIIAKRPLDILAVDILGELVIIELEPKGDETVILRALEHFDWVINNMNSVVQKYRKEKIDITLAPRIIIILGNISENFVRKLTYINTTKIELYEYELKKEDGLNRLNLKPYAFSLSNHKKIEISKPRLEDLLDYIRVLPLRQLCLKIIREIRSLNLNALVDTSKGYIEIQNKEESLLRIYPQPDFFWISFSSQGKWQGIKVKDIKSGEEILDKLREGKFR